MQVTKWSRGPVIMTGHETYCLAIGLRTMSPSIPARLCIAAIYVFVVLQLSGAVYAASRAEPVKLAAHASLAPGPARENSGIVASRRHEGLFWMINDSGDEPRVYPVRRDGSVHGSSRGAEGYDGVPANYDQPGVLIGGAINVDWEDIALDTQGRLLVPDFGNNSNDRRDLVIYVIDEPRPGAGRTTWREKWFFRYPEQTDYPAPQEDFNYDAEALFTVGTTAYLLTKHRSDTHTRLYRLKDPQPHEVNDLELIERFDIGGRVTAADASADGLRLLVATYDTLWVFERFSQEASFFDGSAKRFMFEAEQVEAACFIDVQGEQIMLADEAAAVLFEVSLTAFEPVAESELTIRRQEVQ